MAGLKLAIFSDTHGRTKGMLRAIEKSKPDTVFHLGDCEADVQRIRQAFPTLPICSVSGNCDHDPIEPDARVFTMGGGVKIFATHGHRYRVKYQLEPLLNAGHFSEAQLILFGHTHKAYCETYAGMWVLNPGTAGMGAEPTYGIAYLENGAVRSCNVLPIPPEA